ncbi:hypothetical protein HH310_05350 [Actinoplanes sp. TBRC 11911]|uniref:hypothetical protein n=1 Tax=Actinoplanes sp. TBRC 11911 TaxID=2729386 RepID=UPI00145C4CC2|nr:hypothetical protein [Actinoplanes sp. TBRC 11911]NMO50619.1 hypothetical protein [Actinoplanes sp. TBRC 11911]
MRTPRLAGLGLATLAAAAMTVAGCDTSASSSSAPASSASPSASAAEPAAVQALSAAAAKLGETSFKVSATSGSDFTLNGAVDPAQGVGTVDLTATGPNASLNVKTLLIGQDLYVQVPGVTKAGTWTHLDVSRLPAGANVGLRPGQVDPVDTANLLSSATDVHSTGPDAYAGTLDLSKAAGLGVSTTQPQNVPFTVNLDDQGRLSTMTITPASTAPIEVRYSDYGSPVTASRPAASEITEAPDSLYSSFGGK